MVTCTKRYENYPVAHRIHTHDGLCARIHGHNLTFEIQFSSNATDENDFVFDLGKLKDVKEFFDEHFDHTLLLNQSDPLINTLGNAAYLNVVKVVAVPSNSSEGLAKYVFMAVGKIIAKLSENQIWIVSVTVREDSKNSATYIAE